MTSSFQSYLPYLPYMILGFLATAGALLLRVLYAYSSTVHKADLLKRSLKAPLSLFNRASPQTSEQKNQDAGVPKKTFYERCKFFLTNFWRSSDQEELSLSFLEAMKILKEHFATRNFRYKLPWYLMTGAVDSGKTKILEDLSLDLPVGRPHFNTDDDRPSCKWWFFDRALIIDTIGDYLLPKQGLNADAKGWAFLMNLLVRHRLKRPLDGIILTIPADELIGPHKLGYDDTLMRAKQLNAKLWHLQYSLAMKVPVYILITKTDHVQGFKEFSNELPVDLLNGILGWTCPYSLESQYSSTWVEEIFSTINKSLHKTRAEIFTEGRVKQGRDGTFIFKVEIQKLKENLGIYLNNIFKETTYHESFFLRGVYFCGDTGHHTAVGDHKRDERYWVPPAALGSAIEIPFKQHDERQVSFIHDLFEHKIFRENALARPVRRMLISTSKALNLAKVVVAGIIISWGIGLYHAHDRFELGRKTLLPLVQEVDQTIHNINRRNFDLTTVNDAAYLNDQALRILKFMSDLDLENSFSISIPASWFTTYDADIRRSITAAWDSIVLRSFYSGLMQKARKLFIMLDDKGTPDNKIYLNPLKTPEFSQLKKFVEETAKLEDQVIRFNNLGVSENMGDIGRLINYLFDRDLPKQFYENTSYYQTALSYATEREIKILDFSNSARRKLSLLFTEFLDSSLKLSNENGALAMLIEALTSISQITSTRNFDENKVSNNIQTIFSAAESIRDKEFNWIEGDVFLPGEAYTTSINIIANSRILGVTVTNELLINAQKAFTSYKKSLIQLDAPLIGKIFAIKNNVLTADPSPAYNTLLENLRSFLKQPFMQNQGTYKSIMPIPPGRLLFWDETALASAAKLVQSYEKYATETLPTIPTESKHILEVLGRNALSRNIFHMIANAETFQVAPRTATGFDEQEALNQQVQNLKVVQPQFNTLLSGYLQNDASNQASQLRNLLLNQGHELLHMIDNLLTRDDLYSVGDDLFSWWDGQEMLGLRAFGVYDIDDMKSYLSAQFTRIRFLGKDLADPILSYLNLPYLKGAPRNISLISKWTRILTQIDAYEKQSPSNSVSILEHFLMFDLNQINESMCVDAVLSYDIYEKTGDYFLDRRNKIRRAMIHRCESIARHSSIAHYNELAAFFNRYLAGRFPFSKESKFYGTNEANVDDVNTFLVLFDKINESQRKALDGLIDSPNLHSSPSQFLRQIDLLKPILSAALDANADKYVPKVDFAVDFRTDRNQETEGNKIIDWNLQINDTDIDFRDDKRVGQWVVGDPLCVILRWASDGPTSPILDERQPNLTTSNHTARFSYEGRWSLIRLLKAHAIDYKTYEKGKPTPVTLQFMVPTHYKNADLNQPSQKTTTAKVFLRFSLFDPTKKTSPAAVAEKTKTDADSAPPIMMDKNLLPLPIFPFKAPTIETRVQGQKNKSLMSYP